MRSITNADTWTNSKASFVDGYKTKVEIFVAGVNSEQPKENPDTNKNNVYHNVDTWSLGLLDLNDNGVENKRCYRYILLVIDNFNHFVWTIRLIRKLRD